ncbi:TonB-dependent receptor domain-containing protein [Christiangramia forsetii]|uniref:TonB-dependent outer membrane receptor n=2 Tax=Christiangramia forsetii TaxID=411153 RepID=A0M6M8_CHRFK|nr:outer membrane beta-barrel family protein [Christiangramia forsetii]GGG30003.1 TonB-dependent receptor [Christiangramia forsetii]CAL68273.1 TonB-dependent outer membrane receptor [Christiangramia forsetii KT0803]
MLKNKFIPLVVLLIPYVFFSQNSVSGKILNQDNDPVAFANVILLSAKDSTSVYKGSTSEEDGSFVIENVEDSTYLLKVSFVGYAEYLQKLRVKGDTNIPLISLEEASDALDEVTVNARKPKVTREIDRLVFDVENTILSTGNTFEVLKRTPGVIVSQGNLLVKNRAATVYINDRKVYLSSTELQQLLEGFSAENIKSVEVITNPPAKYDAEGGAILNIKTSKNISIGYKGSLNASNTIAIVPKYNVGTSHYYKTDWLNVYASYNYNQRDLVKKDEGFIEYYTPNGDVDSRWLTDFERNTNMNSHSLNTILDFTLSEASTLSLSANIQITPDTDSDINGLTNINDSTNSLDSLFTTDSRLHSQTDNILLAATYNTSLGENGTLAAIGNYINYDNSQFQHIMTNYFDEDGSFLRNNSFTTEAMQNSEIYTGQVDISTPLGSTSFESGLKYSSLRTESGQDYFDTNTGTRQFSEELSDELDYEEDIYAAYASMSKDWEKWSLKLGLRGEYTDVQGVSESMGLVNSQDYFELFPTFYLNYNASEDHSFSAEYSRRITRPRFEDLNTYRYFLNENNFQDGNPNLMPAISNMIKFSYGYKNKLFFDLYWDKANNEIATIPFQDNTNRNLRSSSLNMDFSQQYSFDISYYDYLNDWWTFSAYTSFFYMQNDFPALESGGQIVTNDTFGAYIYAGNFFTLSKDGTFSGEVTTTYIPDYVVGSYEFEESQFGLNFGLRKTFFDSRLITTVNVEDVFNTMNMPLRSQYLNQNNSFFAMPESRMIRFGVTYKFGNFKLGDNKRAITADESERLETKNP